MSAAPTDISFEQAMERLEEIVGSMESNRMPLDEMIVSYEEGTRLVQLCRERIDQARQRIELINLKADGKAVLSPFEEGKDESAEDKSRPTSTAARRRPTSARSESAEAEEIRLF